MTVLWMRPVLWWCCCCFCIACRMKEKEKRHGLFNIYKPYWSSLLLALNKDFLLNIHYQNICVI